jgi:integrase
MARTVRNSSLESRTARARLEPRSKPYWQALEDGAHLGYVCKAGVPGAWLARFYIGAQHYEQERLAPADDYADADGVVVLSFRQAQAKARTRLIERAHAGAPAPGAFTVRDACEAYLAELAAHGKTAADTRTQFEALIYPVLGDIKVAALTADQLRSWQNDLAQTPARVRTAPGQPQQYRKDNGDPEASRRRRSSTNRVRTNLVAALNFAFENGKVASDTAWRKTKPFEGVTSARVRYLTVAEAKRLINAADPDFRLLVQAALQTGCRYGEAIRLQAQDFNPDAGTLAIRISKSGKSRHVVLTDEGREFFSGLTAGRPGGELMLRHDDGAPWLKSHQDLRMKAACKRAGIEPPVGFHTLRHTWASLSVMAGVPLMVVAKNLGHRDTRMCELHYSHLAPSYITDAIRAGAPRFGLTPTNVKTLI